MHTCARFPCRLPERRPTRTLPITGSRRNPAAPSSSHPVYRSSYRVPFAHVLTKNPTASYTKRAAAECQAGCSNSTPRTLWVRGKERRNMSRAGGGNCSGDNRFNCAFSIGSSHQRANRHRNTSRTVLTRVVQRNSIAHLDRERRFELARLVWACGAEGF